MCVRNAAYLAALPSPMCVCVCVCAATDNVNSNRYECWARSQAKYVLGSDGVGHSFVVGFGTDPPVQCHHRSASCPLPPATCTFDNYNADTANPHILYGALVGGELGCDGITLQTA